VEELREKENAVVTSNDLLDGSNTANELWGREEEPHKGHDGPVAYKI
jgi:hypothetical protein